MALGDIGMFTPAESAYSRPGAYDEMLQAEALKRAAWLSSMDQFYANLVETKREFDLTLAFKEETRDLELDWSREQFEASLALEKDRLSWEKEYGMRSLDVEASKVAAVKEGQLSFSQLRELMEMRGGQTEDILGLLGGAASKQPAVSPPTNKYGQVVPADYGSIKSGKVSATAKIPASSSGAFSEGIYDTYFGMGGTRSGNVVTGGGETETDRPEDWYDWEIG